MSKAIAIFTGGITELRQAAVRDDGVVFTRMQFKGRYGYAWSAWRATGEKLGENAMANMGEMQMGFANLHRAMPDDCSINRRAMFNAKGEIRVRLP